MKKKKRTQNIMICAIFAALLCIVSPFSVPFTVPISLSSLGVFLASMVLGIRRGVPSVALYVAIGAVGAPVFAGFQGGLSVLLGPTGGFILGYIPCAIICAAGVELWSRHSAERRGLVVFSVLSMTAGTAVLYISGTAWYMLTAGVGLSSALAVCVLPFLPGDAVKIALAAVLIPSLREQIIKLEKRIGR